MKKILAFALAIVMVLALGACSFGGTQTEEKKVKEITNAVSTPDEAIDTKKYADNLDGLCAYMADKNCVYDFEKSTADEVIDPIVMDADLIGADAGYKFIYKYEGSEVVLELYSYSKFDTKWYKQVKEDGKITVSEDVENGTFDAILSKNGKYLMVYTDAANRTERRDAVIKIFNSFDVK